MFGLGAPELIVIFVIFILPVFYLLTLQKALNRCSVEARTLSPGFVWLLVIPIFNLYWHFTVVTSISDSLSNEFRKRGISAEEKPGQVVGLAMCALFALSFVFRFLFSSTPNVGEGVWLVTWLVGLICWIVYWVKIVGFSARLK